MTAYDLIKGIDAMNPLRPALRLEDEQQAIAHLKCGNIAGLEMLVQLYQVKAVHAALLIVGDPGTAEDVVQEAFLRAYRKIDQFDDNRPFGPWFLRSVINAALKQVARQKRADPLEDNPAVEWLVDPARGPQELTENAEVREAVWQALKQLTPDQRAAVVLRYYLDESESEMIQELNRPSTTIKWWLHAARQRLRTLLHPILATEVERQEAERESE